MTKTRLEAFSDGVIAIIITIMVLEIKIPHSSEWSELVNLIPVFLSYFMSFLFVGIYWGNHHHLLNVVKHFNSGIMLANLNLLFWLSLVPFATGWMGENHFGSATVALYAILLNVCGVAFTILQYKITNSHTLTESMQHAMKKQKRKGLLSLAGYSLAIPFAYLNAAVSGILFIVVAVMWLIPDKNIEKALKK